MTQILEHFVPNQNLDLETLRTIANSISTNNSYNHSTSGAILNPTATDSAPAAQNSSIPVPPAPRAATPDTPCSLPLNEATGQAWSEPTEMPEDVDLVAEEIDELHGKMAWLRVDSNGVYR